MSQPRTKGLARNVTAALTLAALVAGCSDPGLYLDRRETVALGAGDAVAANAVEQMVDPWPRYSNDKNLAFNGERMQRAVQCYRIDRVTPPEDLNPSSPNESNLVPVAGTSCQGRMTSENMQPAIGAPANAEAAK